MPPPASQQTLFEHPLNERVRTFLRLEHLFEKLDFFLPQFDPWATRIAVEALLEITAVSTRSDLKTDITKELGRHIHAMQRIASQPEVDPAALARVMGDLEGAEEGLQGLTGPIGQAAREDEFLKGVAQRSSIPGGGCSFDLPVYHHWLNQSPERRRLRIQSWLDDLEPAKAAIGLLLSLARASAPAREVTAAGGFFQESLEAQAPAQMVRVALPADTDLFPEISGHKNRFSIRFMEVRSKGKATPSTDDVAFRLTCCVF